MKIKPMNIFDTYSNWKPRKVFEHIQGDSLDQMRVYLSGLNTLIKSPEYFEMNDARKRSIRAELSEIKEWIAIKSPKRDVA